MSFEAIPEMIKIIPALGHGHTLLQTSLYLLGILLAELYLSEAIDLKFVNGHLEPSDQQRFKSNSDIVRHLEKYEEFGGKHPVLGAVHFCFRNARKEEWNLSQKSITKAQVNSLIENVLIP